MSINIANEESLNKHISLGVCAQDFKDCFKNFEKTQHPIIEIMAKKQMLAEFMAVRYLQDRLRQYWEKSSDLPFFYLLTQENEALQWLPVWVEHALKNKEKIYMFDATKVPIELQTQIRRVGQFLTAMAGEYIERVIQFSRETGRPPKIYLDYLKGKHDYPTYIDAYHKTILWEQDEINQYQRDAKVKHIVNLPNGYYAVELLNSAALQLEGRKMANCLCDSLQPYLKEVEEDTPSLTIYSIRNAHGIPRVDVTVRVQEKVISDCAAKANDYVHPEDAPMVAAFVNALHLPMRIAAARKARLLANNGMYYDVFHLPPDKKFYDSCLNLEALDLEELPHLENVVIQGSFTCAHNRLKNLKGAPKNIHGCLSFYDNPIESFEGFPESVGSVSTPIALDTQTKKHVSGNITIVPRSSDKLKISSPLALRDRGNE
ncbi:MAG: hypothetical protein II938_04070 [Alphaproteobacteria bacterium]|nr:hypothetical protein [Alphaproteobacteria bacterium]